MKLWLKAIATGTSVHVLKREALATDLRQAPDSVAKISAIDAIRNEALHSSRKLASREEYLDHLKQWPQIVLETITTETDLASKVNMLSLWGVLVMDKSILRKLHKEDRAEYVDTAQSAMLEAISNTQDQDSRLIMTYTYVKPFLSKQDMHLTANEERIASRKAVFGMLQIMDETLPDASPVQIDLLRKMLHDPAHATVVPETLLQQMGYLSPENKRGAELEEDLWVTLAFTKNKDVAVKEKYVEKLEDVERALNKEFQDNFQSIDADALKLDHSRVKTMKKHIRSLTYSG